LNCYDAAVQLVSGGAKVQFADVDGDTAFVYAKKKNHSGNITGLLDPGTKLAGKNILLTTAKVLLQIIAVIWVFVSIDGLARIVSSFNLSQPFAIGTSIVLAHLLTAYIGIMIWDVKGFLENLRGTFNFLSSSLFYIFLVPILFPLVVALIHFLSRFLPDNINTVFSYSADIIKSRESTAGMLIVYILTMAVWIGARTAFSLITKRFQRVMDNYKYHK